MEIKVGSLLEKTLSSEHSVAAENVCQQLPPVTQNGCVFNGAFPFREVLEGGGLDVTLYRTSSTLES